MNQLIIFIIAFLLLGCASSQTQKRCIPTGIEYTPRMDSKLTLQVPEIPLEMVIQCSE
jgi:uncharacterized protein YcfL